MTKVDFRQSRPPVGFYTYAYLRDSGVPWYIGKGSGRRAWRKHGGKRRWAAPSGDQVLILKWGLTEEQALTHEKYLISVFGREIDGGVLAANHSIGGDSGATGAIWSLEMRAQGADVQARAAQFGLSPVEWVSIPKAIRGNFLLYRKKYSDFPLQDYLDGRRAPSPPKAKPPMSGKALDRVHEAAKRVGLSFELYQQLSKNDRNNLKQYLRLHPSCSATDWAAKTSEKRKQERIEAASAKKLLIGAKKYGACFETWRNLSASARKTVGNRYRRGKRGAALLEGLI
jgi:hypothetical protein